jgi:hypothetical protein
VHDTAARRPAVAVLAWISLGYDYPLDLFDLRPLDTAFANACVDYLNDDRLGICDLDTHLPDGWRALQAWIRGYRLVLRAPSRCTGAVSRSLP